MLLGDCLCHSLMGVLLHVLPLLRVHLLTAAVDLQAQMRMRRCQTMSCSCICSSRAADPTSGACRPTCLSLGKGCTPVFSTKASRTWTFSALGDTREGICSTAHCTVAQRSVPPCNSRPQYFV